METLAFSLERLATPIGPMLLVADDHQRLRALEWQDHEQRMHLLLRRQYRGTAFTLREAGQVSAAGRALQAYFDGELAAIDTLPVVHGGTDFQRQVWTALRGIPAGETRSYRELAIRLGRPAAARAVGLANGSNVISVVAPCHRLVGSDSSLTGYGGGLVRKRWLLAHEQRTHDPLVPGSTPGSPPNDGSGLPGIVARR